MCTILSHFCYNKKTTLDDIVIGAGKKKRTLRCVFKSCFTFPVACLVRSALVAACRAYNSDIL